MKIQTANNSQDLLKEKKMIRLVQLDIKASKMIKLRTV